MPGLLGLEPMPRKYGLLSLRALNSLMNTLGTYSSASLTRRTSASRNVSSVTGVTLTGSDCASAGSFCAVTVTGGSRIGELVFASAVAGEAFGACGLPYAAVPALRDQTTPRPT